MVLIFCIPRAGDGERVQHAPRGFLPKTARRKGKRKMKWYNFETMFISLRDALRAFLHENGIKYELSAAFHAYHFEIYTDAAGAEKINAFIDSQSIKEN